jgi:hypothetical protein
MHPSPPPCAPHKIIVLYILIFTFTVNYWIKIYITLILSVTLNECKTWSLTLSEEHRLRVFQNRMLRRIFGRKRNEVTGGWIKLHNEELHGLYTSPNIIMMIKSKRMRWVGNVARMEEMRNAYKIFVRNSETIRKT